MSLSKRGKKIRAAVTLTAIAAAAAGGVGLSVLGGSTPASPGSHHGGGNSISREFKRVSKGAALVKHVAVDQNVDLRSYFTPLELKLIDNPATNKELLTSLGGLQSAATAAQQPSAHATPQQQQQLAAAAQLLSQAKTIVQYKGLVPDSDAPGLISAFSNRATEQTDIAALGKELLAGNPAMAVFAQNLIANGPAVKAFTDVAAATVTMSPEGLSFLGDLNPAAQAKLTQDITLLSSNLTSKNFVAALDAAQSAVTATQKAPATTKAQQQDLASVAQLLSELKPIAQNNGASASDSTQIAAILKNKQEYGSAILSLYKDYQAGKLPAFVKVFGAKDPAIMALAKAFASDPAANGGIAQAAAKAVASNGPALGNLHITTGVQKAAVNNLNRTVRFYIPQKG